MKEPYMLCLSTTNECNLNCVYCSTNAGKKLPDELSLSEKKRVIKEANDMGVRLVFLCGSGEPMLDKDFYSVLEYIDSLDMTAVVVTNGTKIDEKTADKFNEHKAYIIFKLNSFDKKKSDILVGKKDVYSWVEYNKWNIPSGLKYLLERGFHKKKRQRRFPFMAPFQVQCIISRYNYKEIPKIARFCKENNIYLFLETIIWTGRAVNNYKKLELTKEEYKQLYKKLVKIMGLGFFIHQKRIRCRTERNPVVGVTGDICVCHTRDAEIGNVREKSLKELYNDVQIIRKRQAIPKYKGFIDNPFKTCSGRKYHIMNNKKMSNNFF